MTRPLQILVLLLVLVLEGRAQTFVEGDYQINRKKATAGFEVAELLAGSNITFTWNNTNKTLTLAGSAGTGGTSITTLGTITTGTWTATPITDAYIASAATWNAKQAALVSGTNLKTVNGTSLLGSGNLAVGNVTDGQTLTTGLTFPPTGLKIINDEATDYTVLLLVQGAEQTANHSINFDVMNGTRNLTLGGNLNITANATISGTNTGDQDLTNYVQTGDSPTFNQITLTNGIINSQAGTLSYNFYDIVDSVALPFIAVSLYDDQGTPSLIGSSLFGFRGDGAGSGYQFFQGSTNNFTFEGVLGANTATVSAATFSGSFTGSGANLTNIDAGDIATGTLATARLPTVPVANGGTGATTLTANAVLLGNGTSALQTVAPSTTGNVLTSNGTTWTSAAPTTGANPAGSGSELQFRSSGTAFGAVTNSSVSGGTLTLGNAEALATTPTAYLTLRNTTAATVGVPVQVSPSIVLEGQGWKTTATAASQTVRFRQNVLPVQGTTNPSATLQIQSEINNSGTWANNLTLTSGSSVMLLGVSNGTGEIQFGTTGVNIRNSGGAMLFYNDTMAIGSVGVNLGSDDTIGWASTTGASGSALTVGLWRDANNILAQRNSTNAQTFRLYETDSGANDEYLELTAASGTNLIRPQATGTGTASVVRYHTTTTVFWTSGSGSPESVVTAPVGSLYTRTDGGAATTLYVKESGTGSTGWVAK